jgi:hypothetical protein
MDMFVFAIPTPVEHILRRGDPSKSYACKPGDFGLLFRQVKINIIDQNNQECSPEIPACLETKIGKIPTWMAFILLAHPNSPSVAPLPK